MSFLRWAKEVLQPHIVPQTMDPLSLPIERRGLFPSLAASRLEMEEVTWDFCPSGDSRPWHQPQSKETQATRVLQRQPASLTEEEDAALATTWLQVQVRTQKQERADGCGCCSSLGRQGSGQLCWGPSASGPLISLDPLGSCHPLLTQGGLGLQNQQGPNVWLGWQAWGTPGSWDDSSWVLVSPQSPGGKVAHGIPARNIHAAIP